MILWTEAETTNKCDWVGEIDELINKKELRKLKLESLNE